MTFTDRPEQQRTETIIESSVTPSLQPLQSPVQSRQVLKTSATRFAPDAILAGLVGLVILIVGLLASIRGGFAGDMSKPVINVLGFTHTTTLGLIEVLLGACLLTAGATRSRSGGLFFGAILGIGGFVGAVQTVSFHKSLALESGLAWLFVVAGVAIVLAVLLLPRFSSNSTTISQS